MHAQTAHTGVLPRITVVSGISGGSVLAALWTYGPPSFGGLDDRVTTLLRRGLQRELVTRTGVSARS